MYNAAVFYFYKLQYNKPLTPLYNAALYMCSVYVSLLFLHTRIPLHMTLPFLSTLTK